MTARIALATAAEFPDLDEDAPALLKALTEQGIQGEPAVWTDPDVDWSAYDLVVVRSTWDYQDRHAEYLDWARRVAAVTTLKNSAEVLAWNTDKTYLRDPAGGRPPRRTDRLAGPWRRLRCARGRGVRREARRLRGVPGHQSLPVRRP